MDLCTALAAGNWSRAAKLITCGVLDELEADLYSAQSGGGTLPEGSRAGKIGLPAARWSAGVRGARGQS